MVIDLEAADERAGEPEAGLFPGTRRVAAGPRLVLIVDQFEEVFTQCGDEQERRAFIKALCAAAGAAAPHIAAGAGPVRGQVDAREAPALVVIAIRADFYARSAAYPELLPYLQDHQVLVGPIGEAGLREAIEKPAATAGLVVDAALVEVLLADLGLHRYPDAVPVSTAEGPLAGEAADGRGSYEAGRLALLSYALQQTWRNREGRRLTVAGYRATGGIDGAVAQAANAVYDGLGPAERDILQRVLLRMVTLGDSTPDTRRRVTLAELTGSEDSEQAVRARTVLADLIDARLVTADADTMEITHETLLTAWPRLRQWLTEDRAGLRIHRDLTDAARDWQHEGRDPGRLFRGTRLAVARDWAARHDEDLNADERAFLTASQRDQLRATRLRRVALAALAVLTIVSVTVAGVAFKLRGDALTARDQAIANQLIADAGQLTATDPSLAAQLDLVANQMNPTPDSKTQILAAAGSPLFSPLTGPADSVESVAFSRDGRTLAAGSLDGKVWLWDVADAGHPTPLGQPLAGPANGVNAVAFSPDGRTLAAGGADGKVWLWNVANPARPARLRPLGPVTGADTDVLSVAFSPDGRTLAAGSADAEVWLWNVADPARPISLGKPLTGPGSYVESVAFSPDGRTLAAGSDDDTVWLWNVADPARPALLGKPLTGPTDRVNSVAFSPDGRTLAAGSDDDTVWLWNVANPARPARTGQLTGGPTNAVESVAFSPDGRTLAAGSLDDKVWLWNIADPAHPTFLNGSTNGVNSVAFSPDGRTLAAGDISHIIRLWNLPPNVLTVPSEINAVAFSPDGRTLAAGSYNGKVWLWDVADAAHPTPIGQPLTGPASAVESVAFSPDGRTLAAGSYNGKVWLWNVADPARPVLLVSLGPLRSPVAPGSLVFSVAFSPDGRTLAAGGEGDRVLAVERRRPGPPHHGGAAGSLRALCRLGGVQPGRAHPGRHRRQ